MSQLVVCKDTVEEKIFQNQYGKLRSQDLFHIGKVHTRTEEMFDVQTPLEQVLQAFTTNDREKFVRFCADTRALEPYIHNNEWLE